MAKVHFAPQCAIKYIGSKAKVFNTSIARPKPLLKKGDIIIVDKKTASNLVTKGFGEFKNVEEISFTKGEQANDEAIQNVKDELDAYINENNSLFARLLEADAKISELEASALEDVE